MKKISLIIFVYPFFSPNVQKNSEFKSDDNFSYKAETVVDGLDIAWGMEFLTDGSILIAEQEGKMLHFKDGVTTQIKGMCQKFFMKIKEVY